MSKPRPTTPFIPDWLDEANLTTPEFRVLAKLWRHAGKNAGRDNRCFPGYDLLCKDCRISENTLVAVLVKLEEKNLIRRRKGQNHRNLYDLFTPGPVTPSFAVTDEQEAAPDIGVTDEELATQSFEVASPRNPTGEKCIQGSESGTRP